MKILKLVLFLISLNCFSQETKYGNYSISTASYGIMHENDYGNGVGLGVSLGLQRNLIKNERLRIKSVIDFNYSSSLGMTTHVNSNQRNFSLGLITICDVIKINSFAFTFNTGASYNYLSGTMDIDSELKKEVRNYNANIAAFNIGFGMRINPEKSRFAYNFRVLDLFLGKEYLSLNSGFGLDIKF